MCRQHGHAHGLAGRIAAGDDDAVTQLVSLYSAWIQIVIRRILTKQQVELDAGETEELTADVVYKVCRDIHAFDPDRAALKTWIDMKTISTVKDFLRKRRRAQRRLRIEYREEIRFYGSTDMGYEEIVLLRRYVTAVLQLPEHQRIVYELYDQGKSIAEIARQTGHREGTVKSKLHRILTKLRRAMVGR